MQLWYFLLNQISLFHFRTQDLHRRPGQCRQDDDPVPVSDERGGAHVAHHRLQRGGGGLEEHTLHHVGLRRAGLTQSSVEHILLKHGGKVNYMFTYVYE